MCATITTELAVSEEIRAPEGLCPGVCWVCTTTTGELGVSEETRAPEGLYSGVC